MTQLEPVAIVTAGITLAGLGEVGVLEQLPKGSLLGIIFAMFGVILAFARRDYNRINTALDLSAKAQSDINKKIDSNHAAVMHELNNCVSVPDQSRTMQAIYARVNRNDRRIVVLETKAGLHEAASLDDGEEQEES